MKAKTKAYFSSGILIVLVAVGCAVYTPTQFTEWRGPAEFTGSGGTLRQVDGIDVWTMGEPDRRFKLLGIIEQNYYDNASAMSFLAGATKESQIIKVAKEHGADAIVILRTDSRFTGYTGFATHGADGGFATVSPTSQTKTVIAAVKYLN